MENIRLQSLQILYTFVLRLPQNGRTSGEFEKGNGPLATCASLVCANQSKLHLSCSNIVSSLVSCQVLIVLIYKFCNSFLNCIHRRTGKEIFGGRT